MICEKCKELHEQLDKRSEATKVWIQADLQTRQYAIKMEDERDHWRGLAESRQNEIDRLKASPSDGSARYLTPEEHQRLSDDMAAEVGKHVADKLMQTQDAWEKAQQPGERDRPIPRADNVEVAPDGSLEQVFTDEEMQFARDLRDEGDISSIARAIRQARAQDGYVRCIPCNGDGCTACGYTGKVTQNACAPGSLQDNLRCAEAETKQLFEALKPWGKDENTDRSHLDLSHLSCCAFRAWGAIRSFRIEWGKDAQNVSPKHLDGCDYPPGGCLFGCPANLPGWSVKNECAHRWGNSQSTQGVCQICGLTQHAQQEHARTHTTAELLMRDCPTCAKDEK